jgi:hypothetical protein
LLVPTAAAASSEKPSANRSRAQRSKRSTGGSSCDSCSVSQITN